MVSKGYWGTRSVLKRFDVKSSKTLWRWMNREDNPFPKPDIVQNGAENLWKIETVLAFEQRLLSASKQNDDDFVMEA
ncbi:hypothetical protein DN730_07895 [Marinomonas piezotolerans]|uniref:Uncharacterized protein n=1 Tax=Marinomonas piezotolerans TaxID=2213058 RepID=A0A370U993_9GAMM|nr:hypothetical protein [Marinomonas piezotolerans]RDL44318.1 hypothetical protein DN730_07895 [Marinomonas piezotolerans]